jgi:hypothetical protein
MKTIKDLKTFLNKVDGGQTMNVREMLEYHNYFLRTNLEGCSDHRTHKILIGNLRNYVMTNEPKDIVFQNEPKDVLVKKESKVMPQKKEPKDILPKKEKDRGIVMKTSVKKKK